MTVNNRMLQVNLARVINGFSRPTISFMPHASNWVVVDNGVTKVDDAANAYFDAETLTTLQAPLPETFTSLSFYIYGGPISGYDVGDFDTDGTELLLTWDGTGTPVIALQTAGTSINVDSPGRATITFGSGETTCLVRFTSIDNEDPPINIDCIPAELETERDAGDYWHPTYLENCRKFGILRLMDWAQTNSSHVVDYDEIPSADFFRWGIPNAGEEGGPSAAYGYKLGVPIDLAADLANETDCDIAYCIPHMATDSCITSIATAFRDGVTNDSVIDYELSNEIWNFAQKFYFRDGAGAVPYGTGEGNYRQNAGYRAAEAMYIIREVYGGANRHRWRGTIGAWTASPSFATDFLTGIQGWLDDNSGLGLEVSDLFDSIACTTYFGEVIGPIMPNDYTSVTLANPGVVSFGYGGSDYSHGVSEGAEIYAYITGGMTELHDQFFIATNVTTYTFELYDTDGNPVDTSGYTAWDQSVGAYHSYFAPSAYWRAIKASAAANAEDPTTYPTEYTLWIETAHTAAKNGVATWPAGGTWDSGSITMGASSESYFRWAFQQHKAICDTHSLEMRCYEGGNHMAFGASYSGAGGNPVMNNAFKALVYTDEWADLHCWCNKIFIEEGGKYPSKFVDVAFAGQYGSWGLRRFRDETPNNALTERLERFSANTKRLTSRR